VTEFFRVRISEERGPCGIAGGVRLSEQEQRVQQLHAEIDRRLARVASTD
jgi:hypothetical protein